MAFGNGPRIVTDGLVLSLDAADRNSYPGSNTTWNDISGNGNNGTLTNGPAFSNNSIVFDGTNDYALINNPSTIRNQNFTISMWINPALQQNTTIISIIDFDHAGNPLQGWVMQSEDAITNKYYYLGWYDGSQFQPTGGGGFGVGKGIQMTELVWQNITYSKNGTSLIGYKNGTQVYSGTASNANVSYTSNKNLQIGGCVSVSGRFYKGNMSGILIYNKSLLSSEVIQNYNAQKSRFGL